MYAWLVGRLIRRGYAQAVAGNPGMLIKMAADDIEFVFPGRNSFAAHVTGKPPLIEWMQRFAALTPDFRVHDVVVSGGPWRMRAAVRFSDAIGDDYENQGVEYLLVTWGRLRRIEVFLDTERISEWESRQALAATR